MSEDTTYQHRLSYQQVCEGDACKVACPLHINMPVYYDLMRQGKFEDAYVVLKSANPFPGLTGRVCFFPCEYKCIRGRLDTPISIREIEYYLSDYIELGRDGRPELALYKEGSLKGSRQESVAIIGSGPAGLAAAWDLAHFGYKVTIYEKHHVCGGMAFLGIPVYKLMYDVFERDTDTLRKLGVTIHNSVTVGSDIALTELTATHSAVCLAVGAHIGNLMRIPGEENCSQVFGASDILGKVRVGNRNRIGLGDRVVVIGGGNTAMDMARTSRRLGAEVTVVYRRARENMPAYDYEVNAAEEEGVQFRFLTSPEHIEMDGDKLTGLACSEIDPDSLAEKGSRPRKKENSEFLFPVDSIVRAISEKPNLGLLGEEYMEAATEGGLLQEGLEDGLEEMPGIFAAGDAVTGPLSIVTAMASGRKAARGIDRFIRGVPKQPAEIVPVEQSLYAGVTSHFDELKRQKSHKRIPLEVEKNFELLTEKFTHEEAMEESERCMRCNHSIEVDPEACTACNYCVDACPVDCLTMVTEEGREFTSPDELEEGETGSAVMMRNEFCIRCGVCVNVCPEECIYFKRLRS
ncbi:MAG: FAD-dependent oxidoreductase [Kiritimatiellia bacterium]|jgi:NADPH-dependent glutamate synthase beta subunit-like oxidoreductase/NAD-dependent dihydropyrimidine dehydrogenase PreA subunit|nr:FAD-dependent oxidoreductase [Kiritimatiellia bacterium]MDP6630421.1 FAD-dependent oxidoreductase [Kiritimatiellia bacterium]MDP6809878.1 FAD-dependent oxidoreductase [Kiritimatiellia bacterium]MDP7024270.1 FAD-dependent oxidoreductase [Kiritimatiellia bacterium]